MSLLQDVIEALDLPHMTLAAWGAITGTTACLLAVRNWYVDRSRLRMRVVRYAPYQMKEIDSSLVHASAECHLVAVLVNAGRRVTTLYLPAVVFIDDAGFRQCDQPSHVFRSGQWQEIQGKWAAYPLAEGETMMFAYALERGCRYARVSVADTLGRTLRHFRVSALPALWVAGMKSRHYADVAVEGPKHPGRDE
jgi:hypothetical protein